MAGTKKTPPDRLRASFPPDELEGFLATFRFFIEPFVVFCFCFV
jgi:hypothetical protein